MSFAKYLKIYHFIFITSNSLRKLLLYNDKRIQSFISCLDRSLYFRKWSFVIFELESNYIKFQSKKLSRENKYYINFCKITWHKICAYLRCKNLLSTILKWSKIWIASSKNLKTVKQLNSLSTVVER